MVRFSCFNGHAHSSKPKKTLQPSFEAYQKTLPDSSCGYFPDGLPSKSVTPLLNSQGGTEATNSIKLVSSPERSLKSEDRKSVLNTMEREMVRGKSQFKKSQSLGSGLYQEGRVSEDNDVEDEIGQGYSCDGSNDQNALVFETIQANGEIVYNDTIFSIEDDRSRSQSHSEKDLRANSDYPGFGERVVASGFSDRNLFTPRGITKSCSLTNLGDAVSTPLSERRAALGQRSRSFEDLRVSVRGVDKGSVQGRAEDANDESKAERATFENFGDDNYDSGDYPCLAKDWVVPVQEKVDNKKKVQEEHSLRQWVELPNRDFKIKRIEEWVNDLKHCRELEGTDEPLVDCSSDDQAKGSSSVSAVAKVEDKVNPSVGMEASKRYISSLSAAATNAQLANHGLVVIPFLSAFVSLRVLNLSGNSIVKITSGALPRGLHTLNLSKNNIATIEGLRELTRLRVLDLSYNRILRIGHGLASCSALKELYIAGNKISEVEGLHRLMKLTILDLRFNKISTAKCLGQLAANYNSLQAISLEGNPAQKNVGDDHLKKHLQGLLPHLSYFNRQPTKAGALKDSADRSVRLGMSSHQFDRGLRKPTHGPASSKPSKGRHGHGRLPPVGNKPSASNRNQYPEFGSRILNLRQEFSTMRRSRSEGTLGGGAL